MMVCVLDNLRYCENCKECDEIRNELNGGCILDGCVCQGCRDCDEIRECIDYESL